MSGRVWADVGSATHTSRRRRPRGPKMLFHRNFPGLARAGTQNHPGERSLQMGRHPRAQDRSCRKEAWPPPPPTPQNPPPTRLPDREVTAQACSQQGGVSGGGGPAQPPPWQGSQGRGRGRGGGAAKAIPPSHAFICWESGTARELQGSWRYPS